MAFSKEDTTDKVLMIISDKLRMPKENMKPSATFKDLGVDSLDFFEIVMGMEDLFGIEIKDESADKIATISDAVDLIHGLRTK